MRALFPSLTNALLALVLCGLPGWAPSTARGGEAEGAAPNLMANGDFGQGMQAIDVWDPKPDHPQYDVDRLPAIMDSGDPEAGAILRFPAQDALQTAAVSQSGLVLHRGVNMEMSVTWRTAGGAPDATAEVVLDWATWPNIASMELAEGGEGEGEGDGWRTATAAFKATRNANTLTVAIRNRGAGVLDIREVAVRMLPPDPGQLPAPREVQEGETAPWTDDDCWDFACPEDPYAGEALFDLRPLLEGTAGETGWIRHDENGDFVRGDGSPIRFWAVGTNVQRGTPEDVERHARALAKRGVNMVRHHGHLNRREAEGPLSRPDDGQIDEIHKMVALMKRHGIYSTVSGYWAFNSISAGQAGYRPFGRDGGDLGGLLFWEPELQEAFRNWWRELLTRPNPYCPDRLPLKDDPAFAILQIQNEDSMLFWTQWSLMWDEARRDEYLALNARFGEWLGANGLDLEPDAEFDAWLRENRFPPESKLDFRFWVGEDRTAEPPAAFRLSMRFCAETMRRFNAEFAEFVHDGIGCPVLVNAGNWYTADHVRLMDLERWTYGANEVIGLNRYVDSSQQVNYANPDRAGWIVLPGDYYTSGSCLTGDGWRMLPTSIKQVKGLPTIIPESNWTHPGLYQSEGPLLISAYQSLTGVDAYYWFAVSDPDPYHLPMSGWNPQGMWKWDLLTSPTVLGGWPAAAWLYHRGYVRRGDPAVNEKRGLEGDLWDLKVPVIAEDGSFDPNRPGTARARTNIVGGAPYGAFLVGPAVVEYGPDAGGTRVDLQGRDPADLERGAIESGTGELRLDAPRGVFVLDAPRAQGATGFFRKAGPQRTGDLEIGLENDYATVIAVSLDGEPLSRSGKVLLQVTTLARPYGWRETPVTYESPQGAGRPIAGFRIESVGDGHWSVKNAHGTVAIRNGTLSRATRTDANFYPAGDVPVERRDGTLLVRLPADAMYMVLE